MDGHARFAPPTGYAKGPMSTRLAARILALGLALIAVALAGCGGSPEDDVREAVVAANDNIDDGPKFCNDYVTDELIKKSFGDVKACEAAAKDEKPAKGFEVGEVKVDGEKATVKTKDAETGNSILELVKQDGDWVINDIR